MARNSNRTVLIAVGVFVVIAVLIKFAGAPVLDWLKALHGPAGGGH
jgi:formate hydrogenlyase subunit 3/multisubunit Na+/H+ antiporter MnhD subunit